MPAGSLNEWQTNSEVALAAASSPIGPFYEVKNVVPPWAHNPAAIRAPDNNTATGVVYALYTLGDGQPMHGPPKNCTPKGRGASFDGPRHPSELDKSPKPAVEAEDGRGPSDTFTANFTIHWAPTAVGPYLAHVAQILDWPKGWDYGALRFQPSWGDRRVDPQKQQESHNRATHTKSNTADWDHTISTPIVCRGYPTIGAFGNWNPAPLVHPNGSVYVMAHTSARGYKQGEP